MILDTALLNTQHYKVRIKGKVEQSRKWSSAPLHLGGVAIEKLSHPQLKSPTLLFFPLYIRIFTPKVVYTLVPDLDKLGKYQDSN